MDIKRKWHKLCRVSDGLTRLYTELAALNRDADKREEGTMPALIDAWLLAKLNTYAAKTQEEYRRMATFIKSEFDAQWHVEDVEPKDVARFLDRHFESKPNASNKYRELLSVIFAFAVRKGLRNVNPVSEVTGAAEGKRDRYITDTELDAVRAAALLGNDGKPTPSGPPIVELIDLAYQTAQRIGDLLALNWADVSEDGIMFHPAKTVNSSGVRMLIVMTSDLQTTLDGAKAGKVKAIGPVICTKAGGRFTYSGAQTAWKRACHRARQRYEKRCAERGEIPDPRHLMGMHFHDLRAKALTDKRRQEGAEAAQALAGHTTAEMTAHYTKARYFEFNQSVERHPDRVVGLQPNPILTHGTRLRARAPLVKYAFEKGRNEMTVFTIGYEGLDIAAFIDLLANHGIETVVDIRELPLSRKPGFSKKALANTLNLAGLEYVHMVELGCPKLVRDRYRDDGSWKRYTTGFLKHLDKQVESIAELSSLAASTDCALLCYEADFNFCHRSLVADAVQKHSGATITHITVGGPKTVAPETRSLLAA